MNAAILRNKPRPDLDIENLIAEYGKRSVLRAVFASVLRRKTTTTRDYADDLPNHLRKDIGLDPRPQTRNYWNYM